MAFALSPLPFSKSDLEPTLSRRTIEFHYEKHHASYVTKLNELTKDTPLSSSSLEDVIRTTARQPQQREIFNNAAQIWNHDFFWQCMTPSGGGEPRGVLADQIARAFGSAAQFKETFVRTALHQFGSGWTWLVIDKGQIKIVGTSDAELPLTSGQHALLVCDVWEHAYYLDYQNDREKYVRGFLDSLVNWHFASARLALLAPVS